MERDFGKLWEKMQGWEIPVDSLLVCQGGKDRFEAYRAPYHRDRLHRMFSVTKSFCSLAIGSLAAEGKLSLDEPIVEHFPEYLPEKVHPWLAQMTIREMLSMQTCYSATTYKLHSDQNWVESFFVTPPTHKSGQIFHYDTSASHTLAALVKKLTGKGVLEYLRGVFLDEIGFSKEAYILCDPFGAEMGGSGLMAKPCDLMAVAKYLLAQIQHGKGAFADYLRIATSCVVSTQHFGQTFEEQLGYGYQFWQVRGGCAMYGMGGQYVLMYPELDLAIVVTADSQNIKGGTQRILDAVYEAVFGRENVYRRVLEETVDERLADEQLKRLAGTFALFPCKSGFTTLTVLENDGNSGGVLRLSKEGARYEIPFGWGTKFCEFAIGDEEFAAAASAKWLEGDRLLVRVQLCGECVGSLTFLVRLRADGATLWMRKVEETYFGEFSGFAEGERICG